jgi:hypothetical protein
MEFAQFKNDSVSRSAPDTKWIRTPAFASYFIAVTIAVGLIFIWVGLCAV